MTIHQNSWKWLVVSPISTFGDYFWWKAARVDGRKRQLRTVNICFEKFQCNFVARTSTLIAPVQPVLYPVLSCNKTVPNAPKHYNMHQNMSLLSNGVNQVHSLRQIQMRLRGIHKHYETDQNMSLGSYGVDQVRSLRKIATWFHGTNFCINCTNSAFF